MAKTGPGMAELRGFRPLSRRNGSLIERKHAHFIKLTNRDRDDTLNRNLRVELWEGKCMTLRNKILIAIGMTFACLTAGLYLISRIILLRSFTNLEQQYVRRDVERAQSAVLDELAALDATLFDWAVWDDTHTFVQDTNEAYVASNLADVIFTSSRLNLMLFINSSGQIVFPFAGSVGKVRSRRW